jgi:antirestriction protein
MDLSEYEAIYRVAEIATLLAEHGEAYAAYTNNVGLDYATEPVTCSWGDLFSVDGDGGVFVFWNT